MEKPPELRQVGGTHHPVLKCSGCEEIRPVSEFYKHKNRKSGYANCCKACMREYASEYYATTGKDKISARRKTPEVVTYHKNYSVTVRLNNPERAMWLGAKARAADKGLAFSITPEDIEIPTHCPILGIRISMQTERGSFSSPSLDRIQPDLGYIKGNIAVISNRANTIKSFGTADEHEQIFLWMRDRGVE